MFDIDLSAVLLYVLELEFALTTGTFLIAFFVLRFFVPYKNSFKLTKKILLKLGGIGIILPAIIIAFIALLTNRIIFALCVVTLLGLLYKLWKKQISKENSFLVVTCLSILTSFIVINLQFIGNDVVSKNNHQKQESFTKQMVGEYVIKNIKKTKINELTITLSVPRDDTYLILVQAFDARTIDNREYDMAKFQDQGLIVSGEPGWVTLHQGENDVIVKTHNNRSLYAVKNLEMEVSIEPKKPKEKLSIRTDTLLPKMLLISESSNDINEGVYYFSPFLKGCIVELSLPCAQNSLLHL